MKKLSSGASVFLCIVIFLLIALIILFSAVSASASTSSIPIALVENTTIPYSVGSLCSTSSNASYFISEPIPVEYGVTYILDYYSSYASFGLYFVGIDVNGYVTESVKYAPGKVGSFTAEWTPSSSSTKSLRLRGYMSGYDQCAISSLSAIEFTDYYVSINGSGFHYESSAESIVLDLIVNANNYTISVDGSEEDYYITDNVINNSEQLFVGLGPHNVLDQVDYGFGSYEIVLTSSSPQLWLDAIYMYPLYIDPNGGAWNGSTSTSVFWELPNTDTDEIIDPVRPGYTFSGWSFSGVGEFNDAGDPPHNYEHDTGAGYLTANWVSIPVYTHTIFIDGSSYTFTAENSAPPVTISVTSTGFTMSYGSVSEVWTYSGTGTFLGLQDSSGNKYDIGAKFSLLGESAADKTSSFTPIVRNEYIIVSGLWESNSQLMTGEYLDLSAWPEGLSSVDISFMSSGVSFYQISYRYDLSQGYSIFYGNNLAYSYGLADDPAWMSNNYTKLYFESDQSVPQAFFDWFNSNFKRIGDDPVDPVYTVSINVYDNSGSVLHGTYSLSAPSVSPVLTLSVSAGGLQLFSSEDVVWSWAHNEEEFYGFALSDGSSSAVYIPGQTYTLPGGEPYDLVVSLFVVNKDVNEGQYRVGVFGWLERLYDKICELVERSGIFPDVTASLKIVDFSSIGSFFTDMYNQVTSLFGLRTLIEDPAGPFAWLLDT